MTDTRVDEALPDEDRLPWLEAVEEEEASEGPSAAKLIAFVVIGLAAIGLIVGGLFWIGSRDASGEGGEPELIAAPAGDYKVKPDEPGGMQVEGTGDTAFAASEGAVPKAAIDTGALPETPVTKEAAPVAAPAEPKRAAAPSTAAGATIQLGAFSSQSAANSAWKALSGRFSYLAPLSHSVTPVKSGDATLYRLRASGPDASGICGRLRVAGEACVRID
ncbi:SPOR domain-containing protein [Sphingosinicella humi]|uniref:Sporulation protein n=1 Tax=Allosphingosinicella humi TaxID=2068657 RepID=A0A2U2J4C7_9SPHN|nr:SPOR domain-containing protein [Sphingosinicella humi]PWG03185.1 sporulation protein [Sphingosinicella humi]